MKTVSELGEHRVVDSILAVLRKQAKPAIPFGDDVSAVKLDRGKLLILKTDTMVWDTDVPPGMTARQAGRKALVMNVSDLAAKGVKPLAAVVSLSIPSSTSIDEVLSIIKGLEDGAKEYGL
ncbi:MAG: AIR synthase related protein, partial [Candidatus Nezhaarchaeales archaeon]